MAGAVSGLLLALSTTTATATAPEHDWPADVVQPLANRATGLSGRPLRAAADGQNGLWIAGRGELARWSPAGVSEQHQAAQTAWMMDDHVQHLLAHGQTLWFGTPSGVGRLGVGAPAWFGPDSGLPDPRITALAGPTAEGDVLVGTWRGASRLSPLGRWVDDPSDLAAAPITMIPASDNDAIFISPGRVPACGASGRPAEGPHFTTALVADENGPLWAGDSYSVWVCRDDRWHDIARVAEGVLSLASDDQQRLWIGGGTQLWQLHADALQIVAGPTGPIVALLTRAGGVVAGTLEDGLWDCQADRCHRVAGMPADASITGLAQAGQDLWVTTRAALYRCADRCEPLSHPDLPPAGSLGPVAAGTGVVWFGAPAGGGIVRIDSSGQIRRFSTDRRLPEAPILDLLPTADGLWLATETGLVKYAASEFQPAGIMSASLATHRLGGLLVGGPTGIVGFPVGVLTQPLELPSGGQVRCLRIDSRGHIWAGGPQGLAEFDGHLLSEDHTDRLPDASVRDIEIDSDGRVWVATSGGLASWHDGRWRVFTKADGLPADVVWSVHADRRGGLWVGTFGAGAARFDGEGFRALNSSHGLPSNVVRQILSDGSGNVWFVTDTGLAMVAVDMLPDLRPAGVPLWLAAGGVLLLVVVGAVWRRR